jgi:hypothetical protein
MNIILFDQNYILNDKFNELVELLYRLEILSSVPYEEEEKEEMLYHKVFR